MDKLDMRTKDFTAENIAKLKELFPEVLTEEKIDFERLQLVLGEEVETEKERYDFTWNGKSQAMKLAQLRSTGTLRPCKEESKNWDTTQNLYIEGDNLEVLRLLQDSYHNKVKMIYIDPPYNTGNDFVYNDDFSDNIANYKKITEQKASNPETSGRYHSDWLNMMYPRLRLARNLLREDGAIFISIDDNEVANLLKICREVYGEENYVATLVWEKKKKGAFLSGSITSIKEYVIVFSKSKKKFNGLIGEIAKDQETYPVIKTTNSRGTRIIPKGIQSKYREKNHIVKAGQRISSGNMELILLSDLVIKDGILVEDIKIDSNWIYSQELINHYSQNKELYITQDLYLRRIVNEPREKRLKDILPMVGGKGVSGKTFSLSDNLFNDGWGTNEDGFDELHNLTGHQNVMDFPKPTKLIAKLITSLCRDLKNCIILDFFSGSSTTAHAVMQLNAEDGGNRKSIMVQLPEPCDEDSEAYKAGYKNNSDIGKERIRRAGEKIKEENKDKEGIENLDIGFKVFKLDTSNLKVWNPVKEGLTQLTVEDIKEYVNDFVETILPERTAEDLMYEIILKYKIELTTPLKELDLAGKKCFDVGEGYLLLCLDKDIDMKTIEAICEYKKQLKEELNTEEVVKRVVFVDEGFKDDNVKINCTQTLKKFGIEDIKVI